MRLLVDVGNTDAVFGLHDGTRYVHIGRAPSQPAGSAAQYAERLSHWLRDANVAPAQLQAVVLSSVVPGLTPTVRQMLADVTGREPLVLGPALYPQLPITVVKPDEVGTDLVANALAAWWRYRQTCVVVDFGTALTFTTVSAEGKMLGVAIAPGLKTAVRALFANTAQLPEVPLDWPQSALGQNTIQAIQAGVLLGYDGLVRGMLHRIKTEVGEPCLAVATGGLASSMTALHDAFTDIAPTLTLDGLRVLSVLVPMP